MRTAPGSRPACARHAVADPSITLELALSAAQRDACFGVIQELRPQLNLGEFRRRVARQSLQGYQLLALRVDDRVAAVAGFRIYDTLAWGHVLYIDDLVTTRQQRSQGYGPRLLDWLQDHARDQGCTQLHLDSGHQRVDAHRFYRREGWCDSGLHFWRPV